MKKLLNVAISKFGAYPAMSHALAILKSHLKDDKWLYNNFIQIFSVEKAEEHVIDFFDFNIENTPFFEFSVLEKDWVLTNFSLHRFMESMIDHNYYIICFVDTRFLQKYDYMEGCHDPMIYGYDNDLELYYLGDHIQGGKYKLFTCTYEEFEKAVLHKIEVPDRYDSRNQRDMEVFRVVKYDDKWHKYKLFLNCDYKMETGLYLDKVRGSLKDYLNSTHTTCWGNRIDFMSSEEMMSHNFGLNCYKDLFAHIDRMWERESYSDDSIPAVYVFYSYIALMVRRIKRMDGLLLNKDHHEQKWMNLLNNMDLFQKRLLLEICRKQYKDESKNVLIARLENIRGVQIQLTEGLLCDLVEI